jgi:hypothetical protein
MNTVKASLLEELVSQLGPGNFVYGGTVRSFIDGWKSDVNEVDIFSPSDKPTFKADYFRALRARGWVVEKTKSYVGHSYYNATKNGQTIVLDVRYGLGEKTKPFTEENMLTNVSNLKLDRDMIVRMMHNDNLTDRKKLLASLKNKQCEVVKFNADLKGSLENLKAEGISISNEKEVNMSEKPKFMDMIKSDATNAAYRVAATQMTNGTKAALLKLMETKGVASEKIAVASELLDTEMGASLVALLLGFGLNYAPVISEDPRVERLAGEFRVHGMATAGNAVVGVALEHIMPVVQSAIASLPAVTEETTTTTKARVTDSLPASSEQEEEEELEETTKPKTAAA